MLKNFFLALTLLASPLLYAQWSPEARSFAKEAAHHPFENTYLSTAWDIFHIPVHKVSNIPNTRIATVATRHLFKGQTRVVIHIDPNPKAPLVVLNPGMFSNLENHQFLFDIKVLAEQGKHVILLPNPWDKDILGGGPTYIPGDLQTEGQMLYEILEETLKLEAARIQPQSSKLVGYSYGAFMSAVMIEIDSRHKTPLFSAGATLVGPPIKMSHSLANFDRLLDLEQDNWSSMPISTQFALLTELRRLKPEGTPSARLLGYSRALAIYGGFHRNLITALRHWYAGIHNYGGDALAKERLQRLVGLLEGKEENDVRFMEIFNLYPEINAYLGEAGHLSNYLNKAHAQSPQTSIRILYSENDFLNTNLRWQDYPIKAEWTLPLTTGGHNGFKSLPWFKEILTKYFY